MAVQASSPSKTRPGRRGPRRTALVLVSACLTLLTSLVRAAEVSHTDFYDFSMKKFYIERITFERGALRLRPVSLDPRISKFEFTINGRTEPEGLVRLPRNIEPKPYAFHVLVKPAGGETEETVDFTFYSDKLYSQNGRKKEPSYIIIHRATVATHRPAYVYRAPVFSPADLGFARQTWGHLKAAAAGDIALAQAIEQDVILRLERHRGIPSDAMNAASPRVQFERTLGGRDHVWCGDLALIFQYACVSLGLDARVIQTGAEPQRTARRVTFLSVESHATVEVYSRERRSWVWLDPTGYVLEATIDLVPLTLLQLVEALGTPLEDKITVATFDVKEKQRVELPLAQSPAAPFMRNYFRPGVRLKY
jgi:hypothetical protein